MLQGGLPAIRTGSLVFLVTNSHDSSGVRNIGIATEMVVLVVHDDSPRACTCQREFEREFISSPAPFKKMGRMCSAKKEVRGVRVFWASGAIVDYEYESFHTFGGFLRVAVY